MEKKANYTVPKNHDGLWWTLPARQVKMRVTAMSIWPADKGENYWLVDDAGRDQFPECVCFHECVCIQVTAGTLARMIFASEF